MSQRQISDSALSRRSLLCLGGTALALAQACKKGEPRACNDVSGLSPEDAAARKALDYFDRTPIPSQTCDACIQWVPPPSTDQCGGCKVMKGPVHPRGHCKLFAAK